MRPYRNVGATVPQPFVLTSSGRPTPCSALVQDGGPEATGPQVWPDRRTDDVRRYLRFGDARPADHLGPELVDVGRHRVQDRQPLDRPLADQLDAALARLRPGPGLVGRVDLAVGDGDDRLHRQQRPDRRPGAADPAALLEVL